MPDMMIHHIVGSPNTAANGDFTAFLAVVITRPGSSPPRNGSGIRSAMNARTMPGMHANQNAARQPYLVAMAPPATGADLRIKRLDHRRQLRPWHDYMHVREKLRSARGLRVSLKSPQSLLLHHPARMVAVAV
jgi:hypothetical protein